MVRDVPLLAEDTVRFVGKGPPSPPSIPTRPKKPSRASTWNTSLPAIFDPLEAMEPEPPGPRGLAHLCVRQAPFSRTGISHHATWSAETWRKASENRTGFSSIPLPPPGCTRAHGALCLRGGLDAAGRIQVWANKVPYTLRKQLADALGFSEDQIVVNPCGIGGDFGGKSPAMNVPLAYFLSLRSGRPVKMIMSYTEELMAGNPRHPAVVTIKTGVKSDGTFWARHSTVVRTTAAYSGLGPPRTRRQPGRGRGQYHIPHVQVDSYMVYTNVPCGSYRAPGQPQVVFAVESHTMMIAHEMGIDPYALRLRNVLQDGQVRHRGRYKHVRARQPCEPPSKPPTGRRSLARMLGGAYRWGSVPRDRACTRSPSAWMSMPGSRSTPWCRKPAPAPIPSAGKWWRRTWGSRSRT